MPPLTIIKRNLSMHLTLLSIRLITFLLISILPISACVQVKKQKETTTAPPSLSQIVRWTYNAEMFSKQGNYLKAAQEVQNIIQSPQKNSKYYILTGEYFELADKPLRALDSYRKGINDLPMGSDIILNYRTAMILVTLDRLEEVQEIINYLPQCQEQLDILGLIELKSNNINKAHQYFTKAVQLEPTGNNVGWVYLHMAKSYLKANSSEKSAEALFKAIGSAQNSPLLTLRIRDFWEIQKKSN